MSELPYSRPKPATWPAPGPSSSQQSHPVSDIFGDDTMRFLNQLHYNIYLPLYEKPTHFLTGHQLSEIIEDEYLPQYILASDTTEVPALLVSSESFTEEPLELVPHIALPGSGFDPFWSLPQVSDTSSVNICKLKLLCMGDCPC